MCRAVLHALSSVHTLPQGCNGAKVKGLCQRVRVRSTLLQRGTGQSVVLMTRLYCFNYPYLEAVLRYRPVVDTGRWPTIRKTAALRL